jgi:hypothetical protein
MRGRRKGLTLGSILLVFLYSSPPSVLPPWGVPA